MSRSPRRTRAVIDADIFGRLESLVDAASARIPDVARALLSKLSDAKLVPHKRLPADVTTLGRMLSYRDQLTGRDQQVTLVWPEDADISRGLVSVLTPIGVALLGVPAGGNFCWTTRSGELRALTVLNVTPEAASRVANVPAP